MLTGIRRAVVKHGSLNECFLAGAGPSDATVLPALEHFVADICCGGGNYLLPVPSRGSPCKRLNLYLRWMVRQDDVDPGGWRGISPAKLVVPLDTHMARIGQMLGLTKKRTASLGMALQITDSFRRIVPGDPVKYDFTLTRFGIRSDMDDNDLVEALLE